jgi:methylenetetrahydrofolate dehydrogenase (NADP+)/methenyltetrahydrofolate cyclohydrolase
MKTEAFCVSGSKLASLFQVWLTEQVQAGSERLGRKPGLAVILVGDNPASLSYIKRKEKVAEKCGFKTFDHRLKSSVSEKELSALIYELNQNSEVDGILLQLPLPKGLNENHFLRMIEPAKDADGLHPFNQGLLLAGDRDVPLPCTPKGVMALIDFAEHHRRTGEEAKKWPLETADLSSKKAVVIGRSLLVGKPLAQLLLSRNATVQMLHSKSPEPGKLCAEADIVVAAVGSAELVRGDWVKQGASVIDVGINRGEDGKLLGDVEYSSCAKKAAYITPVPGGVGPMTVAMLLLNTFESFLRRELV